MCESIPNTAYIASIPYTINLEDYIIAIDSTSKSLVRYY